MSERFELDRRTVKMYFKQYKGYNLRIFHITNNEYLCIIGSYSYGVMPTLKQSWMMLKDVADQLDKGVIDDRDQAEV